MAVDRNILLERSREEAIYRQYQICIAWQDCRTSGNRISYCAKMLLKEILFAVRNKFSGKYRKYTLMEF